MPCGNILFNFRLSFNSAIIITHIQLHALNKTVNCLLSPANKIMTQGLIQNYLFYLLPYWRSYFLDILLGEMAFYSLKRTQKGQF